MSSYLIDYSDGYANVRVDPKRYANQSIQVWAPKMWNDMNQTADNFDKSNFATTIRAYVNVMPCPHCKSAGQQFMKTNPPENVSDKNAAKNYVCQLHAQGSDWSSYPKVNCAKGFGEEGDEWYTVMWRTLHNLAENYDPYIFAPAVREQIMLIPCQDCRDNSLLFCQYYPPETARNRREAIYWMCKFHNKASEDAGNGTVECNLDPTGYGYVSGHRDYEFDFGSNFYYGKRGGQKGGRQQRRGGFQQQQQQNQGYATAKHVSSTSIQEGPPIVNVTRPKPRKPITNESWWDATLREWLGNLSEAQKK